MKTNQSERERSINVTPNVNTVTNSQALKISLSKQLKNVKRQKKEEFYQFMSKQPIDNNMNESISKLKHQGLYPSGTTVIVGYSIINGIIEERINKKDRPVKVRNFPGATVVEFSENCLNGFCNVNSLKTLNRGPTCFKYPSNSSCIDLFLTNRQQGFQQTHTIKTDIFDFRNYKHFQEKSFNFELNNELMRIDINNAELKEFNEIFLKVLDKHAPRKQKYIRANNSNYITKALRKEIMHRSRLRNKFLRERTNESKIAYNKQRNICVSLLRKTKRDYFANLVTKIMKDNRKFWKTVNILFSEKSYSKESISLISKNGVITKMKT